MDLEKAQLWAWQWKIQLDTEKTEEGIFSTKNFKDKSGVVMIRDKIQGNFFFKFF